MIDSLELAKRQAVIFDRGPMYNEFVLHLVPCLLCVERNFSIGLASCNLDDPVVVRFFGTDWCGAFGFHFWWCLDFTR